jgi:hypothetical protein
MRLGEILVARGLAQPKDIEAACQLQQERGGRLGEHLIRLGVITSGQLFDIIHGTPQMPRTVEETGVRRGLLQSLMLKFIRLQACETLPDLSRMMHLPQSVVQELLDDAIKLKLLHVIGTQNFGLVRAMRHALTEEGRVEAAAAIEQTTYMGPAPVSLAAFQQRVERQLIANETLDVSTLAEAFAGLVISEGMIRKLAPAIANGRTVMLYGPPGNGKTSIGSRIASLFRDPVFVPYAIEVGGQIIRMFDATLHQPFTGGMPASGSTVRSVQLEGFDARWAVCRRPVVTAGGEMTLEMLDLQWDTLTRTYDAPLHMKALNGMFLIDDFGRQRVSPTELLNRWIIPLEGRKDYLKLNTGATFSVPFDELVIFSTNLEPADLMDGAFLRRLPYKIKVAGPDLQEYRRIFESAAAAAGIVLTDEVFTYVVERLRAGGYELASFQPRFICDQAAQVCRCFRLPLHLTTALAAEALENLYVEL